MIVMMIMIMIMIMAIIMIVITTVVEKGCDLLGLLAELADGLKHGQHLATSSANGALVRVGHVSHHIHSLGLRQGQLWGQAQGLVPLPDACTDGLQHPALGLHRGQHNFDAFVKNGGRLLFCLSYFKKLKDQNTRQTG